MMKQRWGLDRNVLRPTPGDPWGVEQHHWNTGAEEYLEGVLQRQLYSNPTRIVFSKNVLGVGFIRGSLYKMLINFIWYFLVLWHATLYQLNFHNLNEHPFSQAVSTI